MSLTKLLHSPQLDAFFNPFLEEETEDGAKLMPGWRVSGEVNYKNQADQTAQTYLSVSALQLRMMPNESISEDCAVLMDHDSGTFLMK